MTDCTNHAAVTKNKYPNRTQFPVCWGRIVCYVLFYLFYLWMAWQIPYTHDDWDWGLDIGLTQLFYATINSRYAGNALVVIMTRSVFLKTVIMGSTYFLIPYCLTRLTCSQNQASKNHDVAVFLLCNILLLTQKKALLAQTYNWVSGFANFGISILFLLIWVKEVLLFFSNDPAEDQSDVKKMILIATFAVCGNLFLENIAIYTVILGVVLCAWSMIRDRKVSKRLIAMTCGALIGLYIMFSSDIYQSLFSEGTTIGGYREIPMVSFNSTFDVIVHILSRILVLGVRIYADNFVICIMILAMLTYLLHHSRSACSRLVIVNLVISCSLILCQIYDLMCTDHSQLIYLYDFLVSFAFFAAVSIEILLLFRSEKKLLQQLYAIWLSAPLLIAPLVATTEIGHRLFLTSNVLLILVSIMLLEQIRLRISVRISSQLIRICSACVAVILLINGFTYGQIGACKRERDAIIAESVQSNAALHHRFFRQNSPYPQGGRCRFS